MSDEREKQLEKEILMNKEMFMNLDDLIQSESFQKEMSEYELVESDEEVDDSKTLYTYY